MRLAKCKVPWSASVLGWKRARLAGSKTGWIYAPTHVRSRLPVLSLCWLWHCLHLVLSKLSRSRFSLSLMGLTVVREMWQPQSLEHCVVQKLGKRNLTKKEQQSEMTSHIVGMVGVIVTVIVSMCFDSCCTESANHGYEVVSWPPGSLRSDFVDRSDFLGWWPFSVHGFCSVSSSCVLQCRT